MPTIWNMPYKTCANVWKHNRNGRFGNCLSCGKRMPRKALVLAGMGQATTTIRSTELKLSTAEGDAATTAHISAALHLDWHAHSARWHNDGQTGDETADEIVQAQAQAHCATCNVQQQSVTTFAAGDAFVMWPRIAIAKRERKREREVERWRRFSYA